MQNKKLFRQIAAEIAKEKGITFRKAKQWLHAIMHDYYRYELLSNAFRVDSPPQLEGLWKNIFNQPEP